MNSPTSRLEVARLAVFGGTFDPFTNEHLKVIEQLAKQFSRVVVVPSFLPPFKGGRTD